MKDHVNCPNCGIPTIPDKEGLTREEMLCEACHAEPVSITIKNGVATCEDGSSIDATFTTLWAAPTMLAALKRAENALNFFINDEGESDVEALEEVIAAIKAANGE